MNKLLIYLSFLSIPNPSGIGMITLTLFYFFITFTAGFYSVLVHMKNLINIKSLKIDRNAYYFFGLMLFLILNYIMSILYQVPLEIWIKRTIHLFMIPIFYLVLVRYKNKIDKMFKYLFYMGVLEAISIYMVFIINEDHFNRASSIEGMILYSFWIVFSAFYAIQQWKITNKKYFLFIYIFILIAEVLTGSRILLLSTLIFSIVFISNVKQVLFLIILSGFILFELYQYGFFYRFDMSNNDNLITIFAKIEELQLLMKYFLSSPILGVGFGKPYQISIANTAYTYSHNMFMFYLGYGGFVGLLIGVYPIVLLFKTNFLNKLLVISFIIFYFSNTTYTNIKHSIFMALLLILLKSIRR